MYPLFCKTAKRAALAIMLTNAAIAQAALSDVTRIYHTTPQINQFEICSGGGCVEIHQVGLSIEEWRAIEAVFTQKSSEENLASKERDLIAQAIGMLEKIIGEKTSTATDRAGTFGNSAYSGQLDCNDEAINTTTYLRLLIQQGLVKLHTVEDMRTRNFFFTGWPHSTAVMHENASGTRFAVDSWFYDNGVPATIVPFNVWKSGFFPTDSPIVQKREAKSSN